MTTRRRARWVAVLVALLITVAAGIAILSLPADPLDVVDAWIDARLRGDVDTAMSLVADEGNMLGIGVHLPGGRERLRAALEGQTVAGWSIEVTDCAVDGENVTCRYRQTDDILGRWGLALTGEHRYVVRHGKLGRIARIHDSASQRETYAAADAFRSWVRTEHPDLYEVIWIDAASALYTTAEGASAALGLMDEYAAREPRAPE